MTVDRFQKVLRKRLHDLCKTRNIRVLEEMCHRADISIKSKKRKSLVNAIIAHQFNALVGAAKRVPLKDEKLFECDKCGLRIAEYEIDMFLFDYQCSKCGKTKIREWKEVTK